MEDQAKRKYRIGILTFWWSKDNYGQLLQLYALHRHLESLGHYPFLIRYDPRKEYISKKQNKYKRLISIVIEGRYKRLFSKILQKLIISLYRKLYGVEEKNNTRSFELFLSENINLSENIYNSLQELRQNPPDADVYICGSDQIWQQNEKRFNPAYFLDFGKPDIKRISYAASFGKDEISNEFYQLINPYLKRFDLVTVRELSGINICKRAERNDALAVLDPTFLLNEKTYSKISKNLVVEKPFCFIYLLGSKTKVPMKVIRKYVKRYDLKLIYTASQGRYDKYDKIYPTINEWIEYIKKANLIITNSFHGVVFSIIFNKQFVFLPLKGKVEKSNNRIHSLFSMLDIQNRTYEGSIDKIMAKEICYNRVNNNIKQKQVEIKLLFDSVLL